MISLDVVYFEAAMLVLAAGSGALLFWRRHYVKAQAH